MPTDHQRRAEVAISEALTSLRDALKHTERGDGDPDSYVQALSYIESAMRHTGLADQELRQARDDEARLAHDEKLAKAVFEKFDKHVHPPEELVDRLLKTT